MIVARRTHLPTDLSEASHAGLLLARYLKSPADKDHTEAYQSAREELANTARQALSRTAVYARAFQRWESGLPAGTEPKTFRTDPRLVIGLGGHTVLETGLTLHHTYGVPLLPGTALKGLAAHYCNTAWGTTATFRGGDAPGDSYRVLFGTQAEGGLVRFHDGWLLPTTLSTALCDDVMTPHHSAYYMSQPETAPPADFDDPVPVSYLSVAGQFRLAVTPDPVLGAAGPDWAKLAFELLTRALAEWGIGGKTSSGYGRLVPA